MAVQYPSAVKTYLTKTDFVDNVFADHINSLQEEMTAVQENLGTVIKESSGWVGSFDQITPTWGSLKDRIANIEFGLNTAYTDRVKTSGGSVVQPSGTSTINMILKAASSQTSSLLEFQTSAGTVVSKIDASGNIFTSGKQVVPIVYSSSQPSSVPAGTIWVDSLSEPATFESQPGVPAGGSTGQVLAKASGTSYDTSWTSNISGNAGTATKLATAVTINGTSFDGSANINITVPADSVVNSISPLMLGGM